MSTVVKDLGAVSAYAYAVEKGYTGTEAEFAELMADYAEVGQRAEDAADSALESKTAAQTAATTATNKASEATTAAQTATTAAEAAQADADAAALDASQALSAASTATSKATEATTAAATATSAKTDAVAANTAAQSAKTAAQTAQTGAETAAASVQSSAVQIQTNADDISELKEDLTALPYSVYNANDVTDGKYLNSSGEEISVSGWSISDYLTISGYAEYYIKTRTESSAVFCWYYDSSKNPLSSFQTPINGYNVLIAPNLAKYVRFSIHTDETADFKYSAPFAIPTKEKSVPANLIKGVELRSTFRNDIVRGQYFDVNGDIQSKSAWARTPLYPVDSGDIVTLYNIKYQYLNYFDANKHYVSSEAGHEGNVSHVVPDGVAYIACNILATNIGTFNCLVNGIPLGSVYSINWLDSGSASIWKDKQYISHGDSITWQDGHEYGQGEHIGEIARGYQTVFSELVGLGGYANFGKSGWSMGVVNSNGIVNTIKGVADYGIYNICTIACGTNDFKLNVPIGTLGVIGDTTFDDSTFYGAFRDSIEYILTSSPTIRLVLLTPLQRDNSGYDVNYTNSAGHKLIDYVNAIKAIGEMYGLPVCDMYGNSGFTKKTLSTYTMDGLHPNDVGYKRMGDYLTGFLNAVGN